MDPFDSPQMLLKCTCNEEVLHGMCLGALHVRTEDGQNLAGLFSEHREMRQLRTHAAVKDGLSQ